MPDGRDGILRIGNTIPSDIRSGDTPIKDVYVGVGNNAVEHLWTRTPPVIAPSMSAIANQSVSYNGAFSLNVGAITTGTAPITYSATGLPSGMAIASGTGIISGRSTSAGNHSITVTATNSAGSASQSFTLTVRAIAPVFDRNSVTVGVTQSQIGTAARFLQTGSGIPRSSLSWSITARSQSGIQSGWTISQSGAITRPARIPELPTTLTVTVSNNGGSDSINIVVDR